MAKSSWLTISPTSGYGNRTIQNIGAVHTGRLQRQTVVTGRAIGVATAKTYTVTQKAKEEFITIGATSYSVANTGGIVTVSGTSNSPKLTVSVGSGGTLGTLVVNGSTVTNGADISGDPGATAQYSWSIQIQVGENLTDAQREIDVTVIGSSSSITGTTQIVQAASAFEYIFSISAGTATIPASGGNSAITAQLTTKRNGQEISTQAVTPVLSGSATGFSISGTTVTAENRGTTVGEARSITVTGKFITSETGEELSDTVVVSQAANNRVIVYSKPNITDVSAEDIPASGGSVSSATVSYSQSRHYYYDSGVTEELSALTTGGTIDYGEAVSGSNLGTTVTERAIVGQLTFTVSMNGQTSVEQDVSVYQEANVATYGDVILNLDDIETVPATGGTVTIPASASQTISYTSGSTGAGYIIMRYEQLTPVAGFSLDKNVVTVSENRNLYDKDCDFKVYADGDGGKSTSKKFFIYQEAGSKAYSDIELIVTYPTIDAAGGTVRPTVSYSQTWGWNGSTTGGGTITSGGEVTYSGTNVSASDGSVTAGTKGTTASGITTVTTATVEVSLNGKTASKQVAVQQAANAITSYGNVTISGGTVSDIPASGGSVSSADGVSASQIVTYTSGVTRPGEVSISYGSSVEASSLGTTIKNRASVGTFTVTASGEGSKSATKSLTVYQAGNYVEAVELIGFAISYSKSVSAAGGYVLPTENHDSVKFIFTSGSTTTEIPLEYGRLETTTEYSGSAENGFSAPNSSSGQMVATGRATTEGAARNSGTVTAIRTATWTPDSPYSSTGTKTDSASATDYATQEANVKTAGDISYGAWQISVSASNYTTSANACPASGGTCSITRSATRTRTQNYSYTSGATSTEALSNETGTPTLSISGLGALLSGTTVRWENRLTTAGAARQATVTATMDDESATEVVYQQANEATLTTSVYGTAHSVPSEGSSSDLSMNHTFIIFNPFKIEWSSGSDYEYNMMSPTLQPVPDYVKSLFTFETDQSSYVGPDWNLIDSVGVALCVEVSENTGTSERPVSGVLHFNGANSQDFSFNINQEAGSYLNVNPTSLSFAASGGTKTITIDTNESWTIS